MSVPGEKVELSGPEDTPRDDIEKAFAAVELQDDSEAKPDSAPVVKDEPAPKIEGKPGEKVEPEQRPLSDPKEKPGQPPKEEGTVEKPRLGSDPEPSIEKAPNSWKPAAREHWASIPEAAKREIARVDREAQKALSYSATARKFAQEFNTMAAPFERLIAERNSTPIQAAKNMFQTAAGLTLGTPQQKALIVSEIIQNYGIDVRILDQVLTGMPVQPTGANPGGGAPNSGGGQTFDMTPIRELIRTELQPVQQFMGGITQVQKQREQQIEERAQAVVDEFAEKNEFYHDLKDSMADLMEAAFNRGKPMTMQQAYDICIKSDPELHGIVEQRKAAAKSTTAVDRASRAAGSVRGSPITGGGPSSATANRTDDIAAAWDQVAGR